MHKNKYKVAFLGVGNMGAALLRAAIQSQFLQPQQVVGFDKDTAKLQSLAEALGFHKSASLAEAAQSADYVFVCVKPQQSAEVLAELSSVGERAFISIMAGIKIATLEKVLVGSIVRVMPNTPALLGEGISAVSGGKNAQEGDLQFVENFLRSCGKVVRVPESQMDAVTAISGSGPAYVFYFAETLERAAVDLGLAPNSAKELVRQTLLGASKMLAGGAEAAELRKAVTSPGGTTEAALRFLEAQRWSSVLQGAVEKAQQRSLELSQLNA